MKKLFGIEKRLINHESASDFFKKLYYHEWHLWRRYETEKQRDEAFKTISGKGRIWEYRKVKL